MPADKKNSSDILVRATKGDATTAYLTLDDSQSENLGEENIRLSLSHDNPLGFADYVSANISSAVDAPSSVKRYGVGISYEIPYRRSLFGLSYNYNYLSQPFGLVNPLESENKSQSHEINWRYPGYRSKRFKSGYQIAFSQILSRFFIAGDEVDVSRQDTSEISAGYNFTWFPQDNASLDVKIASNWGVPWLGGMSDDSQLPDNEPTYEYHRLMLDIVYASWGELLGRSYNWISAFSGQQTDDILYGSQQFFIGNRYSVRGYGDEYSVSGDKGFYLRNSLSFPVKAIKGAVYFGIDYGQISGFNANFQDVNKLIGSFIGFNSTINGFHVDISVNSPLESRSPNEELEKITANLSYQF